MEKEAVIDWLLRIGLAFSFIYAAISAFIHPNSWIGYLPGFMQSNSVLTVFSVFEILLGLWLLWGRWKFWSALLAALSLLGMIVFNFGAFDIIFRDVPILLMAIILALLNYKRF